MSYVGYVTGHFLRPDRALKWVSAMESLIQGNGWYQFDAIYLICTQSKALRSIKLQKQNFATAGYNNI